MDADRELLQLEQQMRQPDCIMEPDILQASRCAHARSRHDAERSRAPCAKGRGKNVSPTRALSCRAMSVDFAAPGPAGRLGKGPTKHAYPR